MGRLEGNVAVVNLREAYEYDHRRIEFLERRLLEQGLVLITHDGCGSIRKAIDAAMLDDLAKTVHADITKRAGIALKDAAVEATRG